VPAILAHRLGRAYGPDSSRLALQRCLEQPVDGLETDCCLTADGEIVLLHDPLLALATTTTGWAHEHTAAQILASRLRNRDANPTSQPPMRLGELLELAPAEVTLQLEVKAHADPTLARSTAHAVCQQLTDHPARERCEILSFWSGACELAASLGFRARLVMVAEYQIDALCAWARRTGVHGVCVEHFLLSPWPGPYAKPGSVSPPAPSTTPSCSPGCWRSTSTRSPATARTSSAQHSPSCHSPPESTPVAAPAPARQPS
jgi:hypothetical protein